MFTSTPLTNRFESRVGPGLTLFIAFALLIIFVIDLQTRIGVAVWMFYAIPIGATYFTSRPTLPYLVGAIATLFTILDFFLSPEGGLPWASILNRTFFVLMIS